MGQDLPEQRQRERPSRQSLKVFPLSLNEEQPKPVNKGVMNLSLISGTHYKPHLRNTQSWASMLTPQQQSAHLLLWP